MWKAPVTCWKQPESMTYVARCIAAPSECTAGLNKFQRTKTVPIRPVTSIKSPNSKAKKLAQRAIADGQPISIVRPAGIYGPGDLRFLKLFSMVKARRFIMFGSGQTLMHMVYIQDLVDGMIQAAESLGGKGKTMILAGAEYISLQDLVRLVGEAVRTKSPPWKLPIWPLMAAATTCEWVCKPLGVEPPLHRRRAAFFTKDRAFSIDRAKSLIGYDPQISLQNGTATYCRLVLSK